MKKAGNQCFVEKSSYIEKKYKVLITIDLVLICKNYLKESGQEMLCAKCSYRIVEKEGRFICLNCSTEYQGELVEKTKNKSKARFDDFTIGIFKVLFKAFDSFLILLLFNILIIREFPIENLLSNNISLLQLIMNAVIIGVAFSSNLFLVKSILYQIEKRKIAYKKLLSLDGISRGVKVLLNLIIANIIPISFVYILLGRIEIIKEYSLAVIVFIVVVSIAISLFFMILNYVILEFEKSLKESIIYTIKLIRAYEITLLISTIVIVFGLYYIYYLQIYTMYLAERDASSIEFFTRFASVFFTFFIFTLYMGYYKVLKDEKKVLYY
ncbi:hypothetical protein [Natronospora cellulosivora (SeqCode)]